MAWTATSAIVFLIANAAPVVTLDAAGNRTSTTVLGAALFLRTQHLTALAALAFSSAVLMPGLEIGLAAYLLEALQRTRGPRFSLALRVFDRVRRWSMVDVLVVGALVALARLAHLAHIQIGWGLWALLALTALRGTLPTALDLRAAASPADQSPSRGS